MAAIVEGVSGSSLGFLADMLGSAGSVMDWGVRPEAGVVPSRCESLRGQVSGPPQCNSDGGGYRVND